jgi:hypothetical protein
MLVASTGARGGRTNRDDRTDMVAVLRAIERRTFDLQ